MIGIVLEQILNGLLVGSYYIVLSLGLSLIFSLGGVVNLAHGAFYALGAYFAVRGAAPARLWRGAWCCHRSASRWWASSIERLFLLRRSTARTRCSGSCFTFGLAMTAEQSLRLIWGTTGCNFSIPDALRGQLLLGDFIYSYYRLTVLAVTTLAVTGCWLLLNKTPFGMIVRAGTRDPEMVRALGISLKPAQTAVFALGVALAGLAGVLSAPLAGVQPAMGTEILTAAFVVVVIGGLGSFWGVVFAGLLVGVVRGITVVFYPARGRGLDVRADGAHPAVPSARPDGREVREVRVADVAAPAVALLIALAVLPFAVSALGYTHGFATEIALFAMVGPGLQHAARLHRLAVVRARPLLRLRARTPPRSRKFISSRQVSSPALASAVALTALLGVAVGFPRPAPARGVLLAAHAGVHRARLHGRLSLDLVHRRRVGAARREPRATGSGLDLDNQLVFYWVVAALVFAVVVSRLARRALAVRPGAGGDPREREFVPASSATRCGATSSIALRTVGGRHRDRRCAVHISESLRLGRPACISNFSGEILAMSIIGGMRSLLGPRSARRSTWCSGRSFRSGHRWLLFWFGLLFMAFILFSPSGLVASGERLAAPFRRQRGEAASMAARSIEQGVACPSAGNMHACRRRAARGADRASKSFDDFTAVNRCVARRSRSIAARVDRAERRWQDHALQSAVGPVPSGRGSLRLAGRSIDGPTPERIAAAGSAARSRSPTCSKRVTMFENLRLGSTGAPPATHFNRLARQGSARGRESGDARPS